MTYAITMWRKKNIMSFIKKIAEKKMEDMFLDTSVVSMILDDSVKDNRVLDLLYLAERGYDITKLANPELDDAQFDALVDCVSMEVPTDGYDNGEYSGEQIIQISMVAENFPELLPEVLNPSLTSSDIRRVLISAESERKSQEIRDYFMRFTNFACSIFA